MGDLSKAQEKAKRKPGRPPGTGGPQAVTRRNIRMVQKMYAEHAQEALNTYLEIMRDPEVEPAVRIRAAKDITDRAFGTPVSTQIVEKTINDERSSPVSGEAISAAGTAELAQLAQALSRYVEDKENTIDITPELPENYPEQNDQD